MNGRGPQKRYVHLRSLAVNVVVSTSCNRRCPHCCMSDMVFGMAPRFVDPLRVYDDIVRLGEVASVTITGGEATLHPNFLAVAECARIARGGRHLMLITNGILLDQRRLALRFFDDIHVSIYDKKSRAGVTTERGLEKKIRAAVPHGVGLRFLGGVHTTGVRGGDKPCFRLQDTASVLEGRIYPCCVANGIDGAESTELSPGWEQRLLEVPAPCARCVFATR